MSEQLIPILASDPVKAAAIALLLLVVWFLKREYKRRETQLSDFETKMKAFEGSLGNHFQVTRKALASHSEDMGKATKAINGDMIKIQGAAMEMKRDLLEKLDEIRQSAMQLAYESKTLAQMNQMTSERLEEKFEIIRDIKNEITILHGKVYKLEETSGEFRITIAKHEDRHRQIAQALQIQRDELEKARRK